MEFGNSVEKELQKEVFWVPATPQKPNQSAGYLEGKKGGESTIDGVEKGFGFTIPGNSGSGLDSTSADYETSGISILEGNEGSKLHTNETSEDGIGSAYFTVLTPPEKRHERKRRTNGIGVNKKPRQRPKMKKHRPKVVVEGQPRKTPKPSRSRTPKPSTSKLETPKPLTPHEKREYKRKNSVKTLDNISEDVDKQAFDTNPQRAVRSCRRTLNFNLEKLVSHEDHDRESVTIKLGPNTEQAEKSCGLGLNLNLEKQGGNEKDVRNFVQKRVDKSSCNLDLNLNLKSQCMYLSVYRRIFRANQCLQNSRKLGPNFPRMYKKRRMTRQKATISKALWFVIASPIANFAIEEQNKTTINDAESFKYALIMWPEKLKRKRSKRLIRKSTVNCCPPKCEYITCPPRSDDVVPEIECCPQQKNDVKLDIEGCSPTVNCCPPQCEDIMCPPLSDDVVPEIEHYPPQQNVTPDIEGCHPLCNGVFLTPESSHDTFVKGWIDFVIEKLECLDINDECGQLVVLDKKLHSALVPCNGKFDVSKKHKAPPKVDLDSETMRVWKLLMESGGTTFVDEAGKDKEKWWEEQRGIFRGRVDSFIARMHLIQGNRRFSPWKGSVVDSVVGVFLTQNVSDYLSSNAFMSLASRFPLHPISNHRECDNGEIFGSQESIQSNIVADERTCYENGKQSFGFATVKEMSYDFVQNKETTFTGTGGIILEATEDRTVVKEAFPLLDCVGSFPHENSITTCKPCIVEHSTAFREILQVEETSFLEKFYSPENRKMSCDESLINSDIESRGTENERESSRLDRLSELKGSYESVCLPSCHDPYSEVPHAPSDLVVDSFDPMRVFRIRKTIEGWEICKNQGQLEFSGSETLIPQEANPRAQEATTIDRCVTLGKFQVSPDCCLRTEVMTRKTLLSSNNHPAQKKMNSNSETTPRRRKIKIEQKQGNTADWDDLRKTYSKGKTRESTGNTMDSLNWERVRHATVEEISKTIHERGMHNVLAERIKDFLDRLVKDHGKIDLEWLRDVPLDKAKDYLLSIHGLGLKSVECVRLLTLHHHAFPVDTNVGRIAVRLGWVPLQPLPESVQIHLLDQYPLMDSIQKYLWPRLCTLDQRTLYELHYQLITFGKVFCTKRQPNCNACPMKGECRHFASAFASAKLALPAPQGKTTVTSEFQVVAVQNPAMLITPTTQSLPDASCSGSRCQSQNCDPIIDIPESPETEPTESLVGDIEDFYYESEEEIYTLKLNATEFKENSLDYMNKVLQEGEMSNALVVLTAEAASIPVSKLKHVSRLRTRHRVYELPDSHPLLKRLDKRDPDDLCPYLLAIWTTGETVKSSEQPRKQCNSQESGRCDKTFCSCNNIQEDYGQTVSGTILIPCRTANGGSFPLNGTYFQVNEVFADDESSEHPIDVPREWIWNLPRRMLYCGTSTTSIFRGLSTDEIHYCFWRGFVCFRGFNRTRGSPRRLAKRFHLSTGASGKTKTTDDD